jgi:hypothetical protein
MTTRFVTMSQKSNSHKATVKIHVCSALLYTTKDPRKKNLLICSNATLPHACVFNLQHGNFSIFLNVSQSRYFAFTCFFLPFLSLFPFMHFLCYSYV